MYVYLTTFQKRKVYVDLATLHEIRVSVCRFHNFTVNKKRCVCKFGNFLGNKIVCFFDDFIENKSLCRFENFIGNKSACQFVNLTTAL